MPHYCPHTRLPSYFSEPAYYYGLAWLSLLRRLPPARWARTLALSWRHAHVMLLPASAVGYFLFAVFFYSLQILPVSLQSSLHLFSAFLALFSFFAATPRCCCTCFPLPPRLPPYRHCPATTCRAAFTGALRCRCCARHAFLPLPLSFALVWPLITTGLHAFAAAVYCLKTRFRRFAAAGGTTHRAFACPSIHAYLRHCSTSYH